MKKKKMKSYSVFHIQKKTEFEKFNCFFIDFLGYSFQRIKVISTVVERVETRQRDRFALHINCLVSV